MPPAPNETGLQEIDRLCKEKNEEAIDNILNGWKDLPVNIGIIGASRVGKSTFINKIRGIANDHNDAAEVGKGDCTRKIKSYAHPDNKNVVFWDIPGFGTNMFISRSNFLKEVKLEVYDYIMFMFCETIQHEQNIWMIKEIQRVKRKFCIVRTKIDSAAPEEHGETLHEYINSEKEAIRRELQNHSVDSNLDIFAISNVNFSKGEFSLLLNKVLGDLSNEKRESLLYTLGVMSDDMIDESRAKLKERSYKAARQMSAADAIPVPGVNSSICMGVLVNEVSFYREVFQVNDKSLMGLSQDVRKDLQVSTRMYNKDTEIFLRQEIRHLRLKNVAKSIANMVFPIIGSVAVGSASYPIHVAILHNLIDKMAEDATLISRARKAQIC